MIKCWKKRSYVKIINILLKCDSNEHEAKSSPALMKCNRKANSNAVD